MCPLTGRWTCSCTAARAGDARLDVDLCGVRRMKTQKHVGDLLGVGGGAENFAFVVLQWLDPVSDVAGVLGNVGWDSQFRRDEGRCQFGTQFFYRVTRRTKTMLHVPVEP